MAQTPTTDNPEALVAIARAAHVAGDKYLERAARRQLADVFGIRVSFPRPAHSRKEPAR